MVTLRRVLAWCLVVVVSLLGTGLTTAATAAPFTYNATSDERACVHEIEGAVSRPPLFSDVREGSASPSAEARGTSTNPVAPVVVTEAAASAGSTGRTVAGNLTEQLAMKEVVSSPAGTQIANIVMKDARWPAADGWVKMTQRVNGIEVHYVRNTITGAVDDFKFPLPTPGGG